jgi:hypothetical protein
MNLVLDFKKNFTTDFFSEFTKISLKHGERQDHMNKPDFCLKIPSWHKNT